MKSCLSDPLFRYVLGEVEKFPQATFTETELRNTSSDRFEAMHKDTFLKYKQSDPEQETFPCPTPCDKGCDRALGFVGGRYQAICQEYSEVKPITLTKNDLKRYIFDINKLLSKIKQKNQLVGSTYEINDRIIFVGERSVGQKRVAVILGLFKNREEAELTLLGLGNQMTIRYKILVLLPFFDKIPQRLVSNLEDHDILVTRFEEAFPKSDFAIDFAWLERKRPKVGVEYPPKNSKQLKEYDKYSYLCEDRLYVTGKMPKKRSNLVRVNDKEIRVPDNEMLVLLHLVMELKKGEGGWVATQDLYEQEITEEDIPHHLFSRLRKRLAPGLSNSSVEDLLENDGKGHYRISTHPDFVILEKKNWLPKKYNELKEAIRRERERRERQKKRREEEDRKPGY